MYLTCMVHGGGGVCVKNIYFFVIKYIFFRYKYLD